MALRSFLLHLLWLHQFGNSFVVAQVTISQRLCLWPQLETKTITCSSDGSALIFVKSIVMTRLQNGLTTCSTARANDAPELNDCRVTLGARDSYYNDINRLCADKPSCNIHSTGNVAAYVGQTLCGLGVENSTIRNLVILTLQCYAVQVIPPATTATTRTTTTPLELTSTNPVVNTQTAVQVIPPATTATTRTTTTPFELTITNPVVNTQTVTISQRLCLWPQLETKTITCSSDGSALIFVKSIVMTRLLGGLTTCATARANNAPELNDCRVTLGARDSYYADIIRLCADKPSCNIHSTGNVAAYVGPTLCGLGMENSTIRNLVVLTLQCYAAQVTPSATTVTTRTTTTPRQLTSTNSMVNAQTVRGQLTTPSSRTILPTLIDEAVLSGTKRTINQREEIITWASLVFVSSSGVLNAGSTVVALSLGLAAICLVRVT